MTKLKLTLAALVFAVAACGTSAETERKLAELEQANAQKDSLMQAVALSSRLLTDINVEIAKVKVRGRLNVSSESPVTASSDTLIAKLRYVVTRVRETESQLSQSRERIKNLTNLSDSLRATLDSTASNLQAVIATQKQTIDLLTDQVNTLTAENVALRDSLSTGYYVIGTKAELKKRGILTEQGGGRVLFILWRTGKTLQPARNLDPSLFTAIDTRTSPRSRCPARGPSTGSRRCRTCRTWLRSVNTTNTPARRASRSHRLWISGATQSSSSSCWRVLLAQWLIGTHSAVLSRKR